METFIVKVWTPGGGEHLDGVRGTAAHVPSGRHIAFTEPSALISFLIASSSTSDSLDAAAGSSNSEP